MNYEINIKVETLIRMIKWETDETCILCPFERQCTSQRWDKCTVDKKLYGGDKISIILE